MKINIKLNNSNKAYLSNAFQLKTGEPLIICFESEYQLLNAKITIKNGNEEKTYSFNKEFIMPEELLFAGRLYVKVEKLMWDKVVKRWELAPIKIIETNDGLEFLDVIADFEKRLQAVEELTKIYL